jgi:hypothetical protein
MNDSDKIIEMTTSEQQEQQPSPSTSSPENSPQHHDEQRPKQEKPYLYGWRLYLVQASLYLGLVLSIMDSSAVSTALVTIGAHFNDFVHIQWVVLAYMLTYLGQPDSLN